MYTVINYSTVILYSKYSVLITRGREMINSINIDNNLDTELTNNQIMKQNWLQYASAQDNKELSSHYANICQQYKQDKKWLLFINPEESSLEQLAQNHGVDISKVLCVSFKGKNKINHQLGERSAHLDIEQIKNVLSRGNCSAVILSNASFTDTEIDCLDSSARLGETQCVILKSQQQIH